MLKNTCEENMQYIHLNKRSCSGQYSNEFYFILKLLYSGTKSAPVGRRMNNEETDFTELILL